MTPEEWATDLLTTNPPRLEEGWADRLRDKIARAIRIASDQARSDERERCRAIANHYEKGPPEQAFVAGAIRKKIENGTYFA